MDVFQIAFLDILPRSIRQIIANYYHRDLYIIHLYVYIRGNNIGSVMTFKSYGYNEYDALEYIVEKYPHKVSLSISTFNTTRFTHKYDDIFGHERFNSAPQKWQFIRNNYKIITELLYYLILDTNPNQIMKIDNIPN